MLSSKHVDQVRRVFPDAELSVDYYHSQDQYIYSLVANGMRVALVATHARHAYNTEAVNLIIESLVFKLVRDKMYS